MGTDRLSPVVLDNPGVAARLLAFTPQSELASLALLSFRWHQASVAALYRAPRFQSRYSNPLAALLKFLRTLQHQSSLPALLAKNHSIDPFDDRPPVGSFVRILDLSVVKESLYSSVPADFLSVILQGCPGLVSLNLASAEFATDQARRSTAVATHVSLRTIDLSGAVNLTPESLQSLCRRFTSLESLNLSSTHLNDAALAIIAAHCPRLVSVAVGSTSTTDASVQVLISRCPQLACIDLSRCLRISDSSLDILALSSLQLQSLVLWDCRNASFDALIRLVKSKGTSLRRLNLRGIQCNRKNAPMTFERLAELLHSLPAIEELSMDYVWIDAVRQWKPDVLDLFQALSRLRSLTFSGISAETPNNIIWNLGFKIPNLQRLRLLRDSYERDSIVTDMYADVESGSLMIDAGFVKRFHELRGPVVKMSLELEGEADRPYWT
ncbi:uncharacterized protein BJ171DRAFT_518108 [Polychytrium aggregatum]|uniref:uncharacterized protein n=1 Tax=Polychytrium aggregatum TaxID=110093 RepID=UPI0022FEA228|nr:uncharacterized protein BJ171DRAFT_518108 [Polychytrium aggregatum]KAI9199629.1 hypothetical protein BJ171DRAFT_518108 [Polychytrium aggregatum]